ncbi:MAG: segregation/condensation protein A [Proteobacteria bacterium]|jgi:segregation and condensation protein A|nr:segregation/condensation protein A [Pseudomonadota bacterium]
MTAGEQYSRFFEVKLELFDGPLDLLLHLVKKRELPIERVSLSDVTAQYLECIKALRYYDVEVAAEYLVIAATLLSVKASVLLNDPVELIPDDNGDLVDPHEELLRRLRELQAYRAVASDLAARPALGHDVFAAPVKATKIDPALIPLADHQSELLVQALQKVLTRLGEKAAVFAVTIDSISVIDRMRMVVDSIKVMGGRTTFWQIIGGVEDRSTAIGVFIALLELCRRRLISVSQAGPLGEIQVQLLDLAQLAANQMDQFIEEVAA